MTQIGEGQDGNRVRKTCISSRLHNLQCCLYKQKVRLMQLAPDFTRVQKKANQKKKKAAKKNDDESGIRLDAC